MDKNYPILTPDEWNRLVEKIRYATDFYGWKNVSEALQFVVRNPALKSTENE